MRVRRHGVGILSRLIVLLLWSLIAIGPAWATTRYVDATACSGNYSIAARNCTGSDGTSYTSTPTALNATGSGDILYYRAGTYAHSINSNTATIPSGTNWTNAPKIAAYPGETVTLNPASCDIINLGSGSIQYLIIERLIIDGANQGNTIGCDGLSMGSEGSAINHVRLDRVEIKNASGNGMNTRGSGHELLGLIIHANGLGAQNAGYGPGSNGVYGVSATTIVVGGEFYDNNCYGIRFFNSSDTPEANDNVITQAYVHDNGTAIGNSGASTCSGGGGGAVLGDKRNIIKNSLLIHNYRNLEFFPSGSGSAGKSDDNAAYNNTAYNGTIGIYLGYAAVTDSLLINNHVIGNSTNISNSATNTTQTTNRTTGSLTDCATSTSDFTPKGAGSSCNDAGTSLTSAGVTDDYLGTSRPQNGTFDIGAYEYFVPVSGNPSAVSGSVSSSGVVRFQ